jgi:hypothetical protein
MTKLLRDNTSTIAGGRGYVNGGAFVDGTFTSADEAVSYRDLSTMFDP